MAHPAPFPSFPCCLSQCHLFAFYFLGAHPPCPPLPSFVLSSAPKCPGGRAVLHPVIEQPPPSITGLPGQRIDPVCPPPINPSRLLRGTCPSARPCRPLVSPWQDSLLPICRSSGRSRTGLSVRISWTHSNSSSNQCTIYLFTQFKSHPVDPLHLALVTLRPLTKDDPSIKGFRFTDWLI